MKNFNFCKYTYVHRRVLVFLAKKYLEEKDNETFQIVMDRLKVHDMDKMVLYLFWPKKTASEYHKNNAAHHIENNIPKDKYDLIEACLDYDSARYSKSDKPLPCKETIDKHFSEYKDLLYPIMDELGINVDNLQMDKEIKDYIDVFSETVTEEDIYNEIFSYIIDNKDNIYYRLFK